MNSVQHNRTFGKRTVPHTIIIARGDKVRHFTVGPWSLALAATLASALAVGWFGAAAYMVMREDIALAASFRQADMELAYEARIASLRSQLDRVTSRQLLDQKLVETKVDVLLDQQEQLTARYDKLRPLLEQARSNGLVPKTVPVPQPKPTEHGVEPGGPAALAGTVTAYAPGYAGGLLDRFDLIAEEPSEPAQDLRPSAADDRQSALGARNGTTLSEELIHEIGRSIDVAEVQQIVHLERLAESARTKAVEIAQTLESEGIRIPSLNEVSATGGPFEPVPDGYDFEASYAELDLALKELQRVKANADLLPLQAPLASNAVSSRFGVRPDPFLGRSAFHSGIDYAVGSGTTVSATAPGTVILAGRNGGYGNMVEIDHGNGLTTRYAHLARVAVAVGDEIAAGATVGFSGSTGRSTGPHLHYEVRREGKAVDPARFIRAGRKIRSLS